MTERNLWTVTREKLAMFGRLKRVENRVEEGFPDVLYVLGRPTRPPVTGMLELKFLEVWPTHKDTPVHVRSLTIEQVRWMQDWNRGRGQGFFLLRVGRYDHMIFGSATAEQLWRRQLTQTQLRRQAFLEWGQQWPIAEILAVLAP